MSCYQCSLLTSSREKDKTRYERTMDECMLSKGRIESLRPTLGSNDTSSTTNSNNVALAGDN